MFLFSHTPIEALGTLCFDYKDGAFFPSQKGRLHLGSLTYMAHNNQLLVAYIGKPCMPITLDFSKHPNDLQAQQLLTIIESSGVEESLSQLKSSEPFAVLVWCTQTNTVYVRSHSIGCYAGQNTITTNPLLSSQPTALIEQNTTWRFGQQTNTVSTYHLLTNHKTPPAYPLPQPLTENITQISIFAENMGLCVSRMIKDSIEGSHGIQTFIFPITSHMPIKASATHPVFLLPSPFSHYQHLLHTLAQQPHVYVIDPSRDFLRHDHMEPLFHHMHQWRHAMHMITHQSTPEPIALSDSLQKTLTQALPEMQSSLRFYLGRHVFAGFARVCAYYDQKHTRSASFHYPAGELKHGPLAVVDESVLAIIFCPHDDIFSKNIASIHEILCRKGKVLCLTDQEGGDFIRNNLGINTYIFSHQSQEEFIMQAWTAMHWLIHQLEC
ncbi:MAG: SIS domain-containing protein [Alphaproteobacteria bacterium]|nr:SIS domain-containing protein [Alphaproteobacteria bacterium]